MRRFLSIGLVSGIAAGLIVGLAWTLLSPTVPLGIPGEWTWARLTNDARPRLSQWLIGLTTVACYSAIAGWGYRCLSRAAQGNHIQEYAAVLILALVAVAAQLGLLCAAPDGYGLSKWAFALHSPGSNGYYTLARGEQLNDPMTFWREYPEWIQHQDSLHIGTHPPGLLLSWRGVLGLMRSSPGLVRTIDDLLPASVRLALNEISKSDPLPRADRAALAAMGTLTLLLCSLTIAPIYGLSRTLGHPAHVAWSAAALWPLVPSAILFQPAADTAFPLLAASALTCAAGREFRSACVAGAVLALGMQFSLAFLPVGVLAGLVQLSSGRVPWRRRMLQIAANGMGFASVTLLFWLASRANPLEIWWWNQRNHARFYEQFSRSYLPWQGINALELAIGLGLPVAVWAVVGLTRPAEARVSWLALAVIALLQLSGRNLSEVARLWLPLMPALFAAAAVGIDRLGGGAKTLGITLLLLGAQTLLLQAHIQVVYAFAD